MDIDIYDFDGTIVPFDSGSLFCRLLFAALSLFDFIAAVCCTYSHNCINFNAYENDQLYRLQKALLFICSVCSAQKAVNGFWDKHENEVHNWFADRKRYSVVISASPDFLLEEIQKRLGFEKLICTKHNRATGAIIGENCRDEEKVKRLYLEFGKNEINVIDVYSDSLKHDGPIFSLANGGCYHIV